MSALTALKVWADDLRESLNSMGAAVEFERVHHAGGLNDSAFCEIWRGDRVGRLTIYENTPDADFEVLAAADGRALLIGHADTAEDFDEVWQRFSTLLDLPRTAPPRPKPVSAPKQPSEHLARQP